MYLSLFLFGLGLSIGSNNYVILFSWLVTSLLLPYLRVPIEERLLHRQFGKEYENYKKEVPYAVFRGIW